MLDPGHWPGGLAYLVVFLAALIESEAVFVAASALVGRGELHPLGVLVAGALGGFCGDQISYYALRGRLRRWLSRVPRVARADAAIVARVQRHATVMVLALRFLTGIRLAVCAACAYGGVRPLRFSTLNLVGAFVWAATLMSLVAWVGPAALAPLGLRGWWAVLVPAVMVVVFFRWLAHVSPALAESSEHAAGTLDPVDRAR